jgi:3-oxoacyl-(acyl-carrier-protein) synthase III
MGTIISGISTYLPERTVSNDYLETVIQNLHPGIPNGVLYRLFGIENRHFAEKHQLVSDMAVQAANPLWDTHNKSEIDLLIFAAACSDMIEPATSAIIHKKLELKCPAMDIKNACNSFVNALHVANAFINSGVYKKILIVSAEKLSDSIRFDTADLDVLKGNLASFSFGDAASAVIVEKGSCNAGLVHEQLFTFGEYWDLCCIPGGGSAYPHDAEKLYFEGKTHLLKDVFIKHGVKAIHDTIEKIGWDLNSIDYVVTHQVSIDSLKEVVSSLGIEPKKCINVFHKFGNTASVSIPLALDELLRTYLIQKGNKILILGLAAGISISVQCMIWE